MPKVLVIADDLTGATDMAGQFARAGVRSLIPLGRLDLSSSSPGHEVVCANTESRHLPPGEAARRVRDLVLAARGAGVSVLYKKTDSTLRGNIGAEVQALMEASATRRLAFVPAFPRLGRVTREGIHFVDGVPVHETGFARDPRNPVLESHVPTLLARQTNVPVFSVTREQWLADDDIDRDGIHVFDSSAPDDLAGIAAWLVRKGWTTAVAGAAGLSEELARLLPLTRGRMIRPVYPERLLVINGSLNPVSRAQVRHAVADGFARLVIPPDLLVCGRNSPASTSLARLVSEIGALPPRRNVILETLDEADPTACSRLGAARGVDPANLSAEIACQTGRVLQAILTELPPCLLTVFGGDTLQGLADAMGWVGLSPVEEIAAGVVVCGIEGRDGLAGYVAAKPGGFGPEGVLIQIARELERSV